MSQPTDRVSRALVALSVFPVTDPEDVAILLTAWKHYRTLTVADIVAVIAHYAATEVAR
jgi:hypothetical protein